MNSPATGPLRLVRAGVVTAVTIGLATAAHHAAGGSLPGLLIIALLGEGVWGVAYVCARWRLSMPALTVLLGVGQVLLHKAFMLFAMPADPAALPMSALHEHGAAALPASVAGHAAASLTTAPTTAPTTATTTAMTLAHVAVTLALVVVLAAGEQALWRLWCWLTPIALPQPALVPALIFRAAPARTAAPPRALVLRLLAADPRRGPPLLPDG